MAWSFYEALAEHKRAACDVVDKALVCAASIRVFLRQFPYRFLEWVKLWDTWFGILNAWSSAGECLRFVAVHI